jgi:hypothetical protein
VYSMVHGSTVNNGSFAKIAVSAVFAIFAAICANLANLAIATDIYIVKTANCGKLCKLRKLPQNSKIAAITAIAVESLYSMVYECTSTRDQQQAVPCHVSVHHPKKPLAPPKTRFQARLCPTPGLSISGVATKGAN